MTIVNASGPVQDKFETYQPTKFSIHCGYKAKVVSLADVLVLCRMSVLVPNHTSL